MLVYKLPCNKMVDYTILFYVGMFAVGVAVGAILGFGLEQIHGQDTVDPRYYCIEKLNKPFPYSELCREQIMKEIMNYTDGLEK
jgi:hypothetical protein